MVLWNLRRGFCNWIIYAATGRLNFQWYSLLRSCAIPKLWTLSTLSADWALLLLAYFLKWPDLIISCMEISKNVKMQTTVTKRLMIAKTKWRMRLAKNQVQGIDMIDWLIAANYLMSLCLQLWWTKIGLNGWNQTLSRQLSILYTYAKKTYGSVGNLISFYWYMKKINADFCHWISRTRSSVPSSSARSRVSPCWSVPSTRWRRPRLTAASTRWWCSRWGDTGVTSSRSTPHPPHPPPEVGATTPRPLPQVGVGPDTQPWPPPSPITRLSLDPTSLTLFKVRILASQALYPCIIAPKKHITRYSSFQYSHVMLRLFVP